MYIRINKVKQIEKPRGKDTQITHIGLYKDDWTHVKFIAHDQKILDKLMETKIDITVMELEWLLKEHEIEKLIPKEPNLFWELENPFKK
jgi:glycosidase